MAYVSYVLTLVLLFSWFWVFEQFGSVGGDITATQFLRDSETLKSSRGYFKLGFFSPVNSTNRYVGIWYNKEVVDQLEVVWVANRENPLSDSSGVLKISGDGNLQLLDGHNKSIWSSEIKDNAVNASAAQLLDTGNLVLLSNATGDIIWQSFDHPVNSMLPLMKLTVDEKTKTRSLLSSWKSASDPSTGRFTSGIYHRKLTEIFIWDGDRPYWRSGPWDGHVFIGVRSMYYLAPVKGFHFEDDNEGAISLSFSSANDRVTQHYVLTHDGVVLQKDWKDNKSDWKILWQTLESETECDIYGKCGEFGSCNSRRSPICSCLKGFEPRNHEEWSAGNWSSGCVRRTQLQCGTIEGEEDGFLRLRNMKVPDNAEWLLSDDEQNCRRLCLKNCLCSSYAYYLGFGCMIWNGSLIDIQDFSPVGVDLFIRLAHSELGDNSKQKVIIAVIVIMGTSTLAIFLYCLWRWMDQRYGKTSTNNEAKWKYYRVGAGISHNGYHGLPLFKLKELMAATSSFSENNKLGRGGFGLVYKGILEDGQEIAVKRLSTASMQGPQEFMNEVVVISKLQHRNLVRLLGCCVEGEEKLLVYEYMPNKSLDAFLFDHSNREHLDWLKRFNIIKGICRGLLYLHRDSRLRIIHRDLKASNILLDDNLNPKISDFGMARIFENNQDQGDTQRIVGTYGYMSPEYAMEGRYSEKSDVFSFGVLLLEIVSGRRNNSFTDEDTWNLLSHAWKLWNKDDILSLIDPTISEPTFRLEILRCIQVGLLSVQEFPEDRPSITMAVSMIESEVIELPRPTQPGFTLRRVGSLNEAQRNGRECFSVNGVSISSIGGR
ncbi:G-type lectin S-receptor-like serine/threonine-protein kinase At1g11330 [Chenopodium quinoa]|uniref:G-type lectin S-receptor-like serine/threonine-protein kinase At1g11330 n=1 Tax=Chenopodium quinoa TaxID=63459 RepID=UPI000B782DC7|nr:G-type lectin S-receptor-like serine/threonine-protein kinase At1g11330 [Chenopodium quinoa]